MGFVLSFQFCELLRLIILLIYSQPLNPVSPELASLSCLFIGRLLILTASKMVLHCSIVLGLGGVELASRSG